MQVIERIERRLRNALSRELLNHESAHRLAALAEGAQYAKEHMQGVASFSRKLEVLRSALQAAPPPGLVAEFGVWQGETVNIIAEHFGNSVTVHGFDSFEGLPEDWVDQYKKGTFHMEGKLPKVRSNVQLHSGWFENTVPAFAHSHAEEPVAFLHIDCDLYSSTKTILDAFENNLVEGSVILFDEYFNYLGWREHEYKAFQELVKRRSLQYRYLVYNNHQTNAAIQITS